MPSRILLIDDDEVDRQQVRRAVAKSGLQLHELVEAAGGEEGRALAQQQTFDCILLDFHLPDVADTFKLLEFLLSPEGGNNAVVVLTGETSEDIALRLMRAGALDYLAKSDATPSALARAIRFARARREFLTDIDTARRDAEQKSQELDTLNRQQTFLLSIIAHDLRNPFQILLGQSAYLSEAVAKRDPAQIELRAKGIHQASVQASSLMESLFAWARVQMEATDFHLQKVAIKPVIDEVCVSSAADSKGVVVVASTDDIHVLAHRDMLAAVLRNLVSNAVKFSHPGSTVTVSANANGSLVDVSVTDAGVGIPSDVLPRLLKQDQRLTTPGTAGEPGSGIGLALTRDLVDRLGSNLRITSTPGVATSFSFSLRAYSENLSAS